MMKPFCAPFPCTSFRKSGRVVALALLLVATSPVSAWDGDGHRHTTRLALESLGDSHLKRFFQPHTAWLSSAASHPDRIRMRPDHAEAARHFLDAEHFGVGADVLKIPIDFPSLTTIRSYEQLRTDGILPWTVDRVWRRLVQAFRDRRSHDVLVQTATLSHYVADAHVPFHATENYDGQATGQRGIHRRFEGTLLERSIRDTDLKPGSPIRCADPAVEMLRTLQESHSEYPGILDADRVALQAGSGKYDDAYWERFTAVARPVALRRLETGGRRLAGLLEAAWRSAGSPELGTAAGIDDSWLLPAPEFVPRGTQPRPVFPASDPAQTAQLRQSRAQVLSLPSRILGRNMPVTIILPDGYATSGQRYPVLYLLHGASGDHTDWNAKSAIAAHIRSLPLIVVMPDAHGDSFYLDTPGYGKIRSAFLDELVPMVDERYRTIARREGRAIAGLSMGGYGAWQLALSSQDLFACAASLSGALGWGTGPMPNLARKLYPDQTEVLWTRDALRPMIERRVRRGRYNGPALWFDCGKDDFLIESNRQMDSYLYGKRIPVEFVEFNGAHDWAYWDEHIRDVLTFVRRHTASPQP